MKFNARENLASWCLAYVKYIKILQLILDTGEHHHTNVSNVSFNSVVIN